LTVGGRWRRECWVALGAPRQAGSRLEFLNFWPFARKLAFKAPFLPFHCDIWEKMTEPEMNDIQV
jgi:hypothetical protein